MNTREPDWTYATTSLLKVLAVASALFLALSVTERVLWVFVDFDDERTALVYGTAAKVANPDRRLWSGSSDGGGPLGTTYTLQGEPRRAGPGEDRTEYEIAEFRGWVGLLDEGDDLEEFALSRGWLAGAAEEGVVYGLVVDGWKLADLRKLLDDPEVRTVNLADVAFDLG